MNNRNKIHFVVVKIVNNKKSLDCIFEMVGAYKKGTLIYGTTSDTYKVCAVIISFLKLLCSNTKANLSFHAAALICITCCRLLPPPSHQVRPWCIFIFLILAAAASLVARDDDDDSSDEPLPLGAVVPTVRHVFELVIALIDVFCQGSDAVLDYIDGRRFEGSFELNRQVGSLSFYCCVWRPCW